MATAGTGMCECGCGEPTNRRARNRPSRGTKKGEYSRFVKGHVKIRGENHYRWGGGRSSDGGGYIRAYAPGHPRAHQDRYVREHILIAEKALGRPLPQKHEVHHVNEDRSDNSPGNLVICENRAYHFLLHRRRDALLACGHADWRRCVYCGQWGPPGTDVYVYPKGGSSPFHRQCRRKREAELKGLRA